jgi:hypothetical protein
MNNNYVYDRNIFITRMEEYQQQVEKMNQNIDSNRKLLKALKDSMEAFDSLSALNREEADQYLRILCAAVSSSFVIRNSNNTHIL